MSDNTKEKSDVHAGSDASAVRVSQIYAELKETLSETDPEELAQMPEADSAIDALKPTEEVKEDMPEVCHDNICDPATIITHHSDHPEHKAPTPDPEETTLTNEVQDSQIKGVEALRKKPDLKGADDEITTVLSEKFILEGHSYL